MAIRVNDNGTKEIHSINKSNIIKMRKKHEFHKENCETKVRAVIEDMFGNTIVLSGQHAFEWSITVCSHGTYIKTTYENSKEARKQFRKYKNKH